MTKTLSRREAGAMGMLAALLGGSAAAQPRMSPPMDPHRHGAMALTAGDQRYVMDTLRVGGVALRGSQLARSRSASPLVRAFAEMEAREQTGLSQVLGEISGMMGPPPPDPRMAAMEAQLARTSGPAFDRLYGVGQIEGHQQLLRIQEDYLRGGRNAHLRHVATLSRGQILDHLTLLREGPRLLGIR
jgi:predicted outer membrane protein